MTVLAFTYWTRRQRRAWLLRSMLVLLMLFAAGVLLLAGVARAETPRSPAMVRAFRKLNPCPATGKTAGACPGWVVDHRIPLCAGGPDDPRNMAWSTVADGKWKDGIERQLCARLKKCAVTP